MEVYFNSLSIHGQFRSAGEFEQALATVMECRRVLERYGQKLYVDGRVTSAMVTGTDSLRSVINALGRDKKRHLLNWFDREGPHWDAEPHHSADDYLVCYLNATERIVTESVVAEVAYLNLTGMPSGLFSIEPSSWCVDPIGVSLLDDSCLESASVDVPNYWQPDRLNELLGENTEAPTSWREIDSFAGKHFRQLVFAEHWLREASKKPFDRPLRDGLFRLLKLLDDLRKLIDIEGGVDADARAHFESHFVGDGTLFSDSSAREKQRFAQELTFPDLGQPGNNLFCSWHGKVSRLTWRLHFSTPLAIGKPLYVVYFGPKLTKG